MLKFISFGSGSSGNCYYLSTATDALIIDIGVGIRTLKKHCKDYGVNLNKVNHLLITHDHADHIKSVGSFSHDYKVPVYATSLVHKGIDGNYCITRKIAPELKVSIEPGLQLNKAEGVCFVIITDVGCITDEICEAISAADYLVIEANHDVEMLMSGPYPEYLKKRIASKSGHLSNKDCGTALAENMSEHLRQVWLCHLSEENNHPELARKTVESILRSYGVIPGKDVMIEILRRTLPSGPYELGE